MSIAQTFKQTPLALVAALLLAGCGSTGLTDTAGLLRAAHEADDAGRLDECVAKYSQVLASNPDIVAAYTGRANCYEELGNVAAAIHDYRQAVKLSPADPELYMRTGDAEQQVGNKSAAAVDYAHVSELAGATPEQIARSAEGLGGLGFYVQALSVVDSALKLYPDYWRFHDYRARVEIALSNDQAALSEFDKAIRVAKSVNLAEVLRHRGEFYLAQHQFKLAITDYDGSIALDPAPYQSFEERAQALSALGLVSRAVADFTSAIGIYESVHSRDPDVLAFLYVQRGQVYLQQNSRDLALADFQKAFAVSRVTNRAQRADINQLIVSAGGQAN